MNAQGQLHLVHAIVYMSSVVQPCGDISKVFEVLAFVMCTLSWQGFARNDAQKMSGTTL